METIGSRGCSELKCQIIKNHDLFSGDRGAVTNSGAKRTRSSVYTAPSSRGTPFLGSGMLDRIKNTGGRAGLRARNPNRAHKPDQ